MKFTDNATRTELTRHKDFKELRDLLHMAINISKGEQKCSV